jgi:hypothetical protein
VISLYRGESQQRLLLSKIKIIKKSSKFSEKTAKTPQKQRFLAYSLKNPLLFDKMHPD